MCPLCHNSLTPKFVVLSTNVWHWAKLRPIRKLLQLAFKSQGWGKFMTTIFYYAVIGEVAVHCIKPVVHKSVAHSWWLTTNLLFGWRPNGGKLSMRTDDHESWRSASWILNNLSNKHILHVITLSFFSCDAQSHSICLSCCIHGNTYSLVRASETYQTLNDKKQNGIAFDEYINFLLKIL